MNKTVTTPQIRTIHKFLLEQPFDTLPPVNHQLFAVLALIEDGYTEKQIISALDGKVQRSNVMAILARIANETWALFDKIEDDREWHIQFLGKKLLDDYLSVMKKGTVS